MHPSEEDLVWGSNDILLVHAKQAHHSSDDDENASSISKLMFKPRNPLCKSGIQYSMDFLPFAVLVAFSLGFFVSFSAAFFLSQAYEGIHLC